MRRSLEHFDLGLLVAGTQDHGDPEFALDLDFARESATARALEELELVLTGQEPEGRDLTGARLTTAENGANRLGLPAGDRADGVERQSATRHGVRDQDHVHLMAAVEGPARRTGACAGGDEEADCEEPSHQAAIYTIAVPESSRVARLETKSVNSVPIEKWPADPGALTRPRRWVV